jgi:hypothetical protein
VSRGPASSSSFVVVLVVGSVCSGVFEDEEEDEDEEDWGLGKVRCATNLEYLAIWVFSSCIPWVVVI